jgi:16S rRNA (cytidine1402-2'-O)-methyltransferase
MPGTLFVVATPIGNLDDISTRALQVLREVAVIAAEDTRRTAQLLARYAITTSTTSLHEHNEHEKIPRLIGRLRQGENVALVSDAGTPTISDPGRQLVRAAADAALKVEAIPGPNAAITALSVSGFSTETFSFLGFPPTRSNDRHRWFERLAELGGTVVFYEAPHRIVETLRELASHVGDKPVLVCRELTKVHETLVRGPISRVLMSPLIERGEFTVVVDIGHMPDVSILERPADEQLLLELGQMTELVPGRVSNRHRSLVAALARRHGLTTNEVYAAIERARKSVK